MAGFILVHPGRRHGGLLSDDDRALLAGYGLELGQSQRELLYREMTTIYQVCAQPSEKLVVSWPSQGAGGEECRPSFLVGRLRLLFSDIKLIHLYLSIRDADMATRRP